MSKRILINTKAYFEQILLVNSEATLTQITTSCNGVSIQGVTNEAIDLNIYIQAENNSSKEYFAAASSCVYSSFDSRPIVGIYYLNFAGMTVSNLKEYLYLSTFSHELTHILGFSSSLYSLYKRPNGSTRPIGETTGTTSINGTSYSTIILPGVLEYAKSYFRCSTLTGIPLEDEGGQGSANSHWDKTFLPNEYMNPSIENPGIISEFTIRLLVDSGWYKVLILVIMVLNF